MTRGDDAFAFLHAPAALWLDPGLTTGWAKLASPRDEPDVFTSGEADFSQAGHIIDAHAQSGKTAIGWEQTDITYSTYRMPDVKLALEVSGIARWACLRNHCEMLGPAARGMRSLASTEMLKALRWHKPGMPHANDAASHLLSWLIREHRLTRDMHAIVKEYIRDQHKKEAGGESWLLLQNHLVHAAMQARMLTLTCCCTLALVTTARVKTAGTGTLSMKSTGLTSQTGGLMLMMRTCTSALRRNR